MQVQSLGWEDPLKEEMTYSSILTWRIPWTEEPGGLHSPQGCKELEMTEATELHADDTTLMAENECETAKETQMCTADF